ncbi:MAG: hypothetical protein AAFR96_06705 [Planctomycetota bacterium]
MPLYRVQDDTLAPVDRASFAREGVRERDDLQRWLRDAIETVAPDTMVVAEEFSDWEDSRRRIDLLCIDRDARLVVVELKRGEIGAHMELQAIRYAGMVSRMTFEQLVRAHAGYLRTRGSDEDAETAILEFLDWDEPDEDAFPAGVRIVLVASDFASELTTAVLWLSEFDVDIRCVRLNPHTIDGSIVLAIEQCLPVPQAEEFQVRIREKAASVRESRKAERKNRDPHRTWADCRQYGYVSAGGRSVIQIQGIAPGDKILAYRKGHGYVGVGIVTEAMVPWDSFAIDETDRTLAELPDKPQPGPAADPSLREHCVRVDWVEAVDAADAVTGPPRRATAQRVLDAGFVELVLSGFGLRLDDPRLAGATGANSEK